MCVGPGADAPTVDWGTDAQPDPTTDARAQTPVQTCVPAGTSLTANRSPTWHLSGAVAIWAQPLSRAASEAYGPGSVFLPPVGMRAIETAVRSDPDERMPQRGVYGVGEDTCRMVEVDPERFDVMVSDALDGIPAELGELMSNVAVTVEHDSGPPAS